MRTLAKRALCAALTLTLVPQIASAQPLADRLPAMVSALPGGASVATGRSVVVDAASAQLFMMDNGRVVDSMKVVVGKPTSATPAITSTLMAATLNPYWNVPTDLTRTLIAPRVLKDGLTYLDKQHYEVVSGFKGEVTRLDPKLVDWQAVADGRIWVYVRQKPGPANSMGRVKFMIQDGNGIFLHDTPKKELFRETQRELSNGCVRVEDADRLARFLFGHAPSVASAAPEQQVMLPAPVPIMITRLDQAATMQMAALR